MCALLNSKHRGYHLSVWSAVQRSIHITDQHETSKERHVASEQPGHQSVCLKALET
jgi:hypothetical protein